MIDLAEQYYSWDKDGVDNGVLMAMVLANYYTKQATLVVRWLQNTKVSW